MDAGKKMLSNGKIVIQSDLKKIIQDQKFLSISEDWRVEAFRNIMTCLEDNAFPCCFGRNACRKNSLRFAFIGEKKTIVEMVGALTEFTQSIANTELEDRLYSPLLIVFKENEFKKLTDEHDFAWNRIQEMHDHDISPWPKTIPTETDNSEWSFCFGGVELFINVSCPSHTQLKSRNLGRHVVFVINPREHFDVLASHKTPKGRNIREKIRHRVDSYNGGIVPAELGFYGDSDNLEWKQYILNEHDSNSRSRCPLHIQKKENSL